MDTPSILVLGHCAETAHAFIQISHAKQQFQQLGAVDSGAATYAVGGPEERFSPVAHSSGCVKIRCLAKPGSVTVDLPGTSSLVLRGQHSA